jgi:acyl-CoA synthetase (AMP-forming)/AMP-acid ligase II
VCVGRPLPGIDVRIIAISDGPIASWGEVRQLPEGEIGEICVRGQIVTREYFRRPQQTALAKVAAGASIWHRMGDVGYFDERGRLWFCGRKAHRVTAHAGVLFTIPIEQIFNQHQAVYRSALVGVGEPGRQRPVLCVEKEPDQRSYPDGRLIAELRDIGRSHELTRGVETFLIHPRFPVDVRHNAKIFREQLATWAKAKCQMPNAK